MAEIDYRELQRRYPGQFIAQRDGEVVASADTYDELSDQLEQMTDWDEKLVIQFVEPADSVAVY